MADRAKAIEDYSKAIALSAQTAWERDGQAEAKLWLAALSGLPQAPPDSVKVQEWYDKALAGDAVSMVNLGALYADGRGVPRDRAMARWWFEKAAAAGNAEALGMLSRRALLARDFALALDAAEGALKADPSLIRIEASRAHALMLLGRAAEAREVYLAHGDKRVAPAADKLWRQLIAEDFAELRKAGIDHPQMGGIEAMLGARP